MSDSVKRRMMHGAFKGLSQGLRMQGMQQMQQGQQPGQLPQEIPQEPLPPEQPQPMDMDELMKMLQQTFEAQR